MNNYHIIFLDWFNNFLTVGQFAEYYSISEKKARKVIELGKLAHESQFGSILDYVRSK
jgi:hypothetical protein